MLSFANLSTYFESVFARSIDRDQVLRKHSDFSFIFNSLKCMSKHINKLGTYFKSSFEFTDN